MGRLIDSDKLWEKLQSYRWKQAVLGMIIAEQPTIEAIPIPKNATNGEMLKVVFPNKLFDRIDVDWFGKEWWNAPYKAESEDKK